MHNFKTPESDPNILSASLKWKDRASRVAAGIRLRVLEHTVKQNGGYLSQACSSAEIFAAIYCKIMRTSEILSPIMPGKFPGVPSPGKKLLTGACYNGEAGPEYDRFILSPAQYALVLYATLIETGRMDPRGMAEYNRDGGIVEMIGAEHSPGMEVTTGSLGQGISQAAGIALARKLRGDTGRMILLMSDGECQSGQFWEAVQAISFHHLENMLCFVDMNACQCDGQMKTVMEMEPFHERLQAFGVTVHRVCGHDLDALVQAAEKTVPGKATFVLCDTDTCRGLDILKSRYPKFHYVRFKNETERAAYEQVYKQMKENMEC
ncbi:MAG: 1-deoxy-D-xylulose-5-phosphate synthase N-terminal domain-containing protein [Planctomycetia bacterium]|nr:1-deoxy-D-xylulose-5-phosphate synthase N-terminal domain-containing protein [Planctomycetia bacterium]